MIPESIIRDHILAALREIDASSVPWHRTSAKYDLVFEGKRYPPKYVLSIAAKFAMRKKLSTDKFHSGEETNSFLKARDFEVVAKPTQGLHETLEYLLSRYSTARNEPFGRTHEIRVA